LYVRFRLDPSLVEKAKLTDRQRQALEFYDGRNFGYRAVARELDISFESARGLVRAGLRKIEKSTRG
jgi:DNA-directed RNA polymerase specialized sigma24 family protein